jgi:hypothetical protein
MFVGKITSISVPALNVINFGEPVEISPEVLYKDPSNVANTITELEANKRSAFNNYDIYYEQGDVLPGLSTVVLSNTVTGYPPDTDKEFTFELSFRNGFTDNSLSHLGVTYTQISYKGGVTDGSGAITPQSGTLTLDPNDGTSTPTVKLKHGQSISMLIPTNAQVRIEQTPEDLYNTSFRVAAESSVSGHDTDWKTVTQATHTFAFTNKSTEPPSGVSTGNPGIALPLAMMICGFVLLYRSISDLRRRRAAWER